eukprot:CAMPEP_0197037902 /NCGR_PEP_ID=MMETSP1384-20130603/14998_1 /TAXON_ID=29189 /ORGANISM="Ammonia sp." /LENGTH=201 /DNA_ID=CAMNT_0042468279 /DNA_START=181 /DNA_END=786 /DNA_ORIENTATION=+
MKLNYSARHSPAKQSRPAVLRADSEVVDVPTLQRVDANRHRDIDARNNRVSLPHTSHVNIAKQYGKHVYLHHARAVAKRFVHGLQDEIGLQIPDCVISLCISYSFVYEDGLIQLAHHLERALVAWNRPHISSKILFAIIAHFVNRKKKSAALQCVHSDEVQHYYDALLDAKYMVIVEVHKHSKLLAISAPGASPKYYKLVT